MDLPLLNKAHSAAQLKHNKRRTDVPSAKVDPLHELNQCAIFNQKGEHVQALLHAEQAIAVLEQDVLALRTKMESVTQDIVMTENEKNLFLEKTSLLSIAYYNKGCECEHLRKMFNASQAFNRAVNLQSGRHGNQVLLKQFKLSLKQAKFKLKHQMMPTPQKRANQIVPAKNRLRPMSANLNLSAMQTEQMPQYATQYNSTIMANVVCRPNSAAFRDMPNVKHFTQTAKTPFGFGHSSNNTNEVIEISNKNVWSECDALPELRLQPALFQMQVRPPKNGRQAKQRRAVQNKQRRQSEELGSKPKFNQQFYCNVVDEVNETAYLAGSPPTSKKIVSQSVQSPTGQIKRNQSHKKLLQKSGALSLGSQNLFKQSAYKPIVLKEKSSKKIDVMPPSTQDLMSKQLSHTQKLEQTVLQKPKTVKKLEMQVLNLRTQQEPSMPHKMQIKAKQLVDAVVSLEFKQFFQQRAGDPTFEKSKRMILAMVKRRKFRLAAQKVLEQIKEHKKASLQFQVWFQSKQKDPVFLKARKIILALVKRWKFRKFAYKLLKQSKEAKSKIGSMLKRRKVRKAVDQVIQQKKEYQKVSNEFKVYFEQNDGKPLFQKAKSMIIALVKRRRFRNLAKKLLETLTEGKQASLAFRTWFEQKSEEALFKNAIRMILAMVKRRKFRKAAAKILDQIRDRQQASLKFQIWFQSKKKDATFQRAIKMILALVKRRKFRQVIKKAVIMCRMQQQVLLVKYVIRIQCMFRRKLARKIAAKLRLNLEKKMLQEQKKKSASNLMEAMTRSLEQKLEKRIMKAQKLENSSDSVVAVLGKAQKLRFQKELEKLSGSYSMMSAVQLSQKAKLGREIQKAREAEKSKAALLAVLAERQKQKLEVQLELAKQRESQSQGALKSQNDLLTVLARCQREKIEKELNKTNPLQQRLMQSIKMKQEEKVRNLLKVMKENKDDPEVKQEAIKMRSAIKRHLFKKITWQDQYLKRIEDDPKLLEYITRVQSRFRQQKARRIVYAMLTKKRMNDPKFMRAAQIIQSMVRRWRARRIVYAVLTKKRQGDPKFNKAAVMIQSMFRRHKYRSIAMKIVWQVRLDSPKYLRTVVMLQQLIRRRRFRQAIYKSIARKKAIKGNLLVGCVVKLQSLYRRIKAKRRVEMLRVAKHISLNFSLMWTIVKIQRMFRAKRKLMMERVKKMAGDPVYERAIKLIQSLVRRRRMRNMVSNALQDQRRKERAAGQKMKRLLQIRKARKVVGLAVKNKDQSTKEVQVVKEIKQSAELQTFEQFNIAFKQKSLKMIEKQTLLTTKPPIRKESAVQVPLVMQSLSSLQTIAQQSPIIKQERHQTESLGSDCPLDIKRSPSTVQNKLMGSIQTSSASRTKLNKGKQPSIQSNILCRDESLSQMSKVQSPNSDSPDLRGQILQKDQLGVKETTNNQFFRSSRDNRQESINDAMIISEAGSHRQKDSNRSTQSASYKIMMQLEAHHDVRLCIQPAVVKQKNFLMVTLLRRQVPLDRKILPIDIYYGAMAVGLYDLEQFCQEWLMPCLRLKEGKKKSIEVNEQNLSKLMAICNEDTIVSKRRPMPQVQTAVVPRLAKKSGQLSLIKRTQAISSIDCQVEAVYLFGVNQIRVVADIKGGSQLKVDLDAGSGHDDHSSILYHQAESFMEQLTITDQGLVLKKASQGVIKEQNIVLRTGKTLQGRFYLISVGCENNQLVIDAYDSRKESHLVLRSDWGQQVKLTNAEASQLAERVDVMELAGQLMLVVR